MEDFPIGPRTGLDIPLYFTQQFERLVITYSKGHPPRDRKRDFGLAPHQCGWKKTLPAQ